MVSMPKTPVLARAGILTLTGLALLPASIVARAVAAPDPAGSVAAWPSFRGPAASGVSESGALASSFSVERSENIRWKTRIPGLGHSSPVIWGDRVFVTSAVKPGEEAPLQVGLYGAIAPVPDEGVHRFTVYCLDRKTGAVLWERTAHEGAPKFKRHTKSSHANPTPATDGRHLVVFFGSEGLYTYDLDGRLLWKKDLGALDSGYFMFPEAQWGFASSPVIHQDRVIVQCDVQGGGFVAAFRLSDGVEIWRTKREDVPTWSTPAVLPRGDSTQVVVNGLKRIGGYDTATGSALWWMRGGGDIPVPTPVAAHGLIFITNAHGGPSPIYAIRADASGEIAEDKAHPSRAQIAWSVDRGGAYMQTPLVYSDHLYVCRDNGILTVFEAQTGKELHQTRLGTGSTGFTASAVAGDGKLYYTAESGEVYVLAAGAAPSVLSTNDLGETAMATPAIADGVIYFRTRGHLVAVGAAAEGQTRPAR